MPAAAGVAAMMSGNVQLPLGIRLRPASTFDSFVAGANTEAVNYLATLQGAGSAYVWGAAGTGKTHLLQAVCQRAASEGARACYLPLADDSADDGGIVPAMLEGLEVLPVVCVDDLQAVIGDEDWERALFALFNDMKQAGGRLILCADRSPRALAPRLADLASRLGWGPVFQLHALDDADLERALRQRAAALGLDMPAEVAAYMIRHCVRDTTALFALLAEIDQAALSARRRLTVPFVKETLQRMGI